MEMLQSDNIAMRLRVTTQEGSGKFSGCSDIILDMCSLMNSHASEDTKILIESVKRNEFSFVSKPIRQPAKTDFCKGCQSKVLSKTHFVLGLSIISP